MKMIYVCYLSNKKTDKQIWYDSVTELMFAVGKWNAKGYNLVGTYYSKYERVVYLEKDGELWNKNKDWVKSHYDQKVNKVYGWSC